MVQATGSQSELSKRLRVRPEMQAIARAPIGRSLDGARAGQIAATTAPVRRIREICTWI